MVNVKEAAESIGKLAMLRFFPSDPNAQTAIVQLACQMADSNEKIDWLVTRMTQLYNEWPGPIEMRACFCSRFRPKDAIERHSQIYLDGIPSQSEEVNRLILGPNHAKGLIEGRQEERGPMQVGIDPVIKQVARLKSMNRVMKRANPAPISPQRRAELQAMIDRAVEENRARRAKEEAGL